MRREFPLVGEDARLRRVREADDTDLFISFCLRFRWRSAATGKGSTATPEPALLPGFGEFVSSEV